MYPVYFLERTDQAIQSLKANVDVILGSFRLGFLNL